MAEFCLACLNKYDGGNWTEKDVVLSEAPDICEGCGEWKHTVVRFRRPSLLELLFCIDKR